MRNDEPDALDRALDKALAQYSSEEPLAGLEQRVLHRVRAEGARPRFGFGRWVLAVGVAVAAGMLATAVLWKRPVPLGAVAGQARRPVPLAAQKRAAPAGFRKRAGQARRPVPLPRRSEFPTPAPVTSEERALLAFVTRAPDVAREAFIDLQRRSTEPIQVEEIRIEPLRSHDAKDDAK
jgi:hypothetical protein